MNNVFLVGRLVKDIEIRYTEKEIAVGNFTLAVNRDYKNEEGKYEADFINCVTFGNAAKFIGEYMHKGDLLGIKGKLQTRNYEDKEGKKHYITEVVVEKATPLGIKKQEEKVESKVKEETTKEDPYKEFGESIVISDEDLPF